MIELDQRKPWKFTFWLLQFIKAKPHPVHVMDSNITYIYWVKTILWNHYLVNVEQKKRMSLVDTSSEVKNETES